MGPPTARGSLETRRQCVLHKGDDAQQSVLLAQGSDHLFPFHPKSRKRSRGCQAFSRCLCARGGSPLGWYPAKETEEAISPRAAIESGQLLPAAASCSKFYMVTLSRSYGSHLITAPVATGSPLESNSQRGGDVGQST